MRARTLSPWISTFSHPGVRDYSQLTLDLTRNELIVGARNFLFRLDLSNMSLTQLGKYSRSPPRRRAVLTPFGLRGRHVVDRTRRGRDVTCPFLRFSASEKFKASFRR
ncbi:hypothetical protein F2P81_021502 [Scophthalmus maximus]|uniref:Uncharacterized protein n=1 Tax=Scophthalmus maximus TaxID=52904 RepID=A0A6A4S3F8_SCOMX|nr:hypothetical protein F2P81_021502 [Scophthalmus maximus]